MSENKSIKDRNDNNPEMEAFGWWFASGKFDDSWSIKQLLETLEITNKTDPDHLVVKRLAGLSSKMPPEVVQCLDLLCKGDKEGWKMHGWKEEAKIILIESLKAKGKTREKAENLIHYLGSRDWIEFGELLEKT